MISGAAAWWPRAKPCAAVSTTSLPSTTDLGGAGADQLVDRDRAQLRGAAVGRQRRACRPAPRPRSRPAPGSPARPSRRRTARSPSANRPARRRRHHQRQHVRAAGGLAEDGDVVRIAAERGDVALHPLQRRDLVHQTVVGQRLAAPGRPWSAPDGRRSRAGPAGSSSPPAPRRRGRRSGRRWGRSSRRRRCCRRRRSTPSPAPWPRCGGANTSSVRQSSLVGPDVAAAVGLAVGVDRLRTGRSVGAGACAIALPAGRRAAAGASAAGRPAARRRGWP